MALSLDDGGAGGWDDGGAGGWDDGGAGGWDDSGAGGISVPAGIARLAARNRSVGIPGVPGSTEMAALAWAQQLPAPAAVSKASVGAPPAGLREADGDDSLAASWTPQAETPRQQGMLGLPQGLQMQMQQQLLMQQQMMMQQNLMAQASIAEPPRRDEPSDDEFDVYGRRRAGKDKKSADKADKAPLSKAERQKAALERLRKPKRPSPGRSSPPRRETGSAEAATTAGAQAPGAAAVQDVMPGMSAAMMGFPGAAGQLIGFPGMMPIQAPVPDVKRRKFSEPSVGSDAARWICDHCGFSNRSSNARCGGVGSMGCKRIRY
eukprot:TRINITY_DN3781_c0_g1_i1.p1 TRINITY_DN3781_c0_g1~~TRINITY_DN3781_c0_g1_i1.p1  ORF type:complete len:320 (-),score=79.40 TRINITY_DN3781_c0_g1_i1:13-972(-)